MERKTKKIIGLLLFSGVLALITARGVKLVKGDSRAKAIVNRHYYSYIHEENVVAHRGFSGIEPDNSFASVNRALLSDCVDMIEIDVRMTNDGKIILHHDSVINIDDLLIHIEDVDLDSIDETTLKNRYPHNSIQNYIYDDSLFLFNRWIKKDEEDQEIIRFSSFINWYNFAKPLIVDVKANYVNIYYMEELNKLLYAHRNEIYIQSTNYLFLKNMMDRYPEYRYFFIVDEEKDIARMDDEFTGYTVRQGLLSKVSVKDDKMYLIWTVNSSARYLNLVNNKKYRDRMYIITDHPDYICALGETKRLKR